MTTTLHVGDCVEVMAAMPPASVDAIVTDPPYGIGFMGKAWDGAGDGRSWAALGDAAGRDHTTTREPMRAGEYDLSLSANRRFQGWVECWAAECLRVLKPGGHLLAFGGTRTYHRLAAGIEDAGFEVRDCLAWLYGSGFPKSLDVSKAIDKAAGAEREVVGTRRQRANSPDSGVPMNASVAEVEPITAPATPEAQQWDGWGTALKPAHEPIVLARKPLIGTVAANVLAHGTGALNVDACRIAGAKGDGNWRGTTDRVRGEDLNGYEGGWNDQVAGEQNDLGRWPANVVLDPEAGAMLDEQSGATSDPAGAFGRDKGDRTRTVELAPSGARDVFGYGDAGGASRFYYCAKASSAERNAGLDELPSRLAAGVWGGAEDDLSEGKRATQPRANVHPTVKPIALMRWLIRLVTPPDGVVLDPFTGSGTTGAAAALEGVSFVGVEREDEYAAIAEARIEFWRKFEGADEADVLAAEGKAAKVRDAGQLGLLD